MILQWVALVTITITSLLLLVLLTAVNQKAWVASNAIPSTPTFIQMCLVVLKLNHMDRQSVQYTPVHKQQISCLEFLINQVLLYY
jgi:hypothetical protein